MLSEFQTQKWNHFFNILDSNKNDKVTELDFIGIAENLCVLWGYRSGTEEFDEIVEKGKKIWKDFSSAIPRDEVVEVYRDEMISLAEKLIEENNVVYFDSLVEGFVGEVFDLFDSNQDGYISLDEYVDLFMAYHIEIRYSGKAFTKLDLNGDDLISKEELWIAVKQYFISDDKEERGNWLFGFWNVA
ncbi:MAG: hypothetical protein JXR03_19310 [Cyclobacteriaceae bacterium]